MSRFEYLSVLVSIVVALGLSEVASSWGRLLRHRARVRFYWLHAVWSAFVVLFMIQFWWGFWNFRTIEEWSFLGLVCVVGEALVMVLASLILMPGDIPSDGVDLREHYYEQKSLFFGLAFVLLCMLALVDSVVSDQKFLHLENAIRGAGLVVAAWAAVSDREGVHVGLTVAGLLLFGWFAAYAAYW